MAETEILLRVRDYDLSATLNSGQVFRWQEHNGAWNGVVGRQWVRLIQTPDGVQAETAVAVSRWDWLREFLRTEVDLAAVLETFPDDAPMRAAMKACHGLRVLRQEPWECLASFILSSNKQIVQIRQIISLLCERYGKPLPCPLDTFSPSDSPRCRTVAAGGERDGMRITRKNSRVASPGAPPSRRRISGTRRRDTGAPGFAGSGAQFSFPSPARIAAASESELRGCKMGFRAPHLLAVARQIDDGQFDLKRPRHLSLADAREELMKLPGVGGKIADCVLLFAYGFDAAFPVDVWVERALRRLYFPRRHLTPERLRHFAATHFGPYAGYAQQYLFHYMRTKMN